ncbi:hypothetical protein SDJN02_26463, partial [Cucurbita argyrosperma subsp. argyrosperma]
MAAFWSKYERTKALIKGLLIYGLEVKVSALSFSALSSPLLPAFSSSPLFAASSRSLFPPPPPPPPDLSQSRVVRFGWFSLEPNRDEPI